MKVIAEGLSSKLTALEKEKVRQNIDFDRGVRDYVSTMSSIQSKAILDYDFINSNFMVYRNKHINELPFLDAVTCARNSTGTADHPYNIVMYDVNEPRLQYDPTHGARLGLLSEEQRTNLLLHSESFDNAAWTKTNATITANATTAPDKALTADKVVENTASSTHLLRQAPVFTAATTYTFSAYMKAGERTALTMIVLDNASNIATWHVNLATGVISQGVTSLASTAVIVSVGDGWYRVSITFTSTASPVGSYVDFRLSDVWPVTSSTGTSYTGNGTSGLYIWGAQIEVGPYPTSYIPTTTAQVPRVADVISRILSHINEGTIFSIASGESGSATVVNVICALSDNTDSNRVQIRRTVSGSGVSQFAVVSGGTVQATALTTTKTKGQRNKYAISWKKNEFLAAEDGVLVMNVKSGNVPTNLSTLHIGSRNGGIEQLNGTIERLVLIPRALTAAELQAITA